MFLQTGFCIQSLSIFLIFKNTKTREIKTKFIYRCHGLICESDMVVYYCTICGILNQTSVYCVDKLFGKKTKMAFPVNSPFIASDFICFGGVYNSDHL